MPSGGAARLRGRLRAEAVRLPHRRVPEQNVYLAPRIILAGVAELLPG